VQGWREARFTRPWAMGLIQRCPPYFQLWMRSTSH